MPSSVSTSTEQWNQTGSYNRGNSINQSIQPTKRHRRNVRKISFHCWIFGTGIVWSIISYGIFVSKFHHHHHHHHTNSDNLTPNAIYPVVESFSLSNQKQNKTLSLFQAVEEKSIQDPNENQNQEEQQQQQQQPRQPQFQFDKPPYDISNITNFENFWHASHTKNYTTIPIGYMGKDEIAAAATLGVSSFPLLRDPPRMLIGIITTTSSSSKERRRMIRETYLNYFHEAKALNIDFPASQKGERGESVNNPMCKLHEATASCRLAYVFVAAAIGKEDDSFAPTMLLRPNASWPLTVDRPRHNVLDPMEEEEDDVIYLNIRENMNEGKIPTWFKYASQYMQYDPTQPSQQSKQFDYIAKVDEDTLLFTGNLVDVLQYKLPKPDILNTNSLVYGGTINRVGDSWKYKCQNETKTWETCSILGPLWMVGPFYFLSRNLTDYIVSDVIDHEAIRYVEDVSTASYVWSHPSHVTIIEIPHDQSLKAYRYTSHHQTKPYFSGVLYAHSEDACWSTTGPYFKSMANTRKVWREYMLWRMKLPKRPKDRYRLYNYPPDSKVTMHSSDYIYSNEDPYASPIVLEDPYNIIFFPITGAADVTWRCIIRRLMGYQNWDQQTKQFDGLKFLSNYTVKKASDMLFSSSFTRVMFVRHPLERLQANYIQVAFHDPEHDFVKGCDCARNCGLGKDSSFSPCFSELQSFGKFLHTLRLLCVKSLWRPMSKFMEPKYYKMLDYVGRYESFSNDVIQLFNNIRVKNDIKTIPSWITKTEIESLYKQMEVPFSILESNHSKYFDHIYWKDRFKEDFATDLKSEFWQYNVSLPKAMNRKAKFLQNAKGMSSIATEQNDTET